MASWITIDYTPQYTGCHRICFTTTAAQYCCYQDDTPSVIGTPKSIDISLSDYIDCLVTIPVEIGCGSGVVVNGYVQPCCSDANSDENRTIFTAPFPTPTACSPYSVQCNSGNCGKFIVPDCNGQSIPTQYELRSDVGSVSTINVCSGGSGPIGGGYVITPDPTYTTLGPELVVNGDFTTDLNGWIPDGSSSVLWSSNYGGSANFGASDSLSIISQDILTVGQTYTVNIDLSIIFNSTPGWCSPTSQGYTQFNVYAGTAVYGPLNFSGSESFTFDITCTDNLTFKIEAWDPDGCTFDEIANIAQMFCSYVSVKEVGAPIPVSCCECLLYNVIVRNPIDIHYTNCNQTIDTVSVEPGVTGITVCAIRDCVWPVNKLDNTEILAITEVGDCIPTE
jgi:hypothetical protein